MKLQLSLHKGDCGDRQRTAGEPAAGSFSIYFHLVMRQIAVLEIMARRLLI